MKMLQKIRWSGFATFAIAVILTSCGKDDGGTGFNPYTQNNNCPYGQTWNGTMCVYGNTPTQCSAGYVPTAQGCLPQGNCPAGQVMQGNQCMPATPAYPNTNQCVPGNGRLCLKGQAYATTDLAQACTWAAGMIVNLNGQTFCRTERNLGAALQDQAYVVGNFTKNYMVNPTLYPNDVLKIHGTVRMNNSQNPWQIVVSQNGAIVGQAQSGAMVSEDGGNVLIKAVNQGYGPYVITFSARGSYRIQLQGYAIACENGIGNSYPCQ